MSSQNRMAAWCMRVWVCVCVCGGGAGVVHFFLLHLIHFLRTCPHIGLKSGRALFFRCSAQLWNMWSQPPCFWSGRWQSHRCLPSHYLIPRLTALLGWKGVSALYPFSCTGLRPKLVALAPITLAANGCVSKKAYFLPCSLEQMAVLAASCAQMMQNCRCSCRRAEGGAIPSPDLPSRKFASQSALTRISSAAESEPLSAEG